MTLPKQIAPVSTTGGAILAGEDQVFMLVSVYTGVNGSGRYMGVGNVKSRQCLEAVCALRAITNILDAARPE